MSDDWTQVPPGVSLEGTVIYDFPGDGPYQIPLKVGETVVIMFESTNGWLKGYVVGREDQHGIFPTSFVELGEHTDQKGGEGGGTNAKRASSESVPSHPTSEYSDASLLREVRLTVREWEREMRISATARGSRAGSSTYHQLKNRIGAIMQHAGVLRAASSGARGMASQGAKPEALDAAKDIARESIIKLLEVNRRTRAGFLVPRTEQGELAVLENTCLVKLYELHREMQLDLEDGANVADRLSREELDALRSRDGGGDGQLLQKAAVKSAVTHQAGKANVLRRRRIDDYKKKDLNDTAINKAQDARDSQAERLAKMCQLKLSYEVAMLSVGEPLEIYFSIFCTGTCACTQFDLSAPLTAADMANGSAVSSSGGNGTGMSTMLLKQQSTRDGIAAGMSLSDVYKSTGANGGIGGGSIGRERNGSRSAGAATMDSVAHSGAATGELTRERAPASQGFFLSEDFLVSVTEKGLPSDASLIGKIGTVFRNIERSEVLGGIYLVCRVYRIGVLETSQLGKDNSKRHGMFSRSSHNGSNVNAQPHRRPYGVACFDLSSNISKLENIDWSPPPLTIYTTRAKDAIETRFSSLHLNIIDNKLEDLEVAPRCRGVIVKMHMDSGGAPLSNDVDTAEEDSHTGAAVAAGDGVDGDDAEKESTSKKGQRESELVVTSETPRACFGSLVDPSTQRDDLYVTLLDGTFSKDGKRAQKNVGIVVYALSNDGTHIPCLSRGTTNLGVRATASGKDARSHKLDSAYHATVFYHNGTPRFNETVRIDLSVPGAREAHLLFLISHCSSKHSKTQVFGFGYLPLSETAEKAGSPVLSDGIHIVTTYMPTSTMVSMGKAEMNGKLEKVNSSTLHPLISYLTKNTRANPPVARRDILRVATRLCSNQSTQIRNLRDLLKMQLPLSPETALIARQQGREVSDEDLEEETKREAEVSKILERVTYFDGTHVAVYVGGIFNQLFEILAEEYISLELQREVFGVIIQCVNRLAGKHSNQAHKDALDIYVSEVFQSDSESLYKIIVDQATELIDWLDRIDPTAPLNQDGAKTRRTLNEMMRCFEYVVEFATTAGLQVISELSIEVADQKGELISRFKHSLQQLMYYVDNLMLKQVPTFVRVIQDLAIENFTPVFEHLERTFDQRELGEIARGFIESVPHDESQRVSLRMKKLKMVHSMMRSSSGIFTRAESRAMCIAPVVRMLQEFTQSHRGGERILTVLILKELVQITHDASSTDDAWNLSCMLPEIAQMVATLMEERKAALAPEKTAAKAAMSGIAPSVSPGETTIDEAGGQGDGTSNKSGEDSVSSLPSVRRISIAGMPSIAHGREGKKSNNRLLRATSIASRLATSTGTTNTNTTTEYEIDTLQILPPHVRSSKDLLENAILSLFEIIRMMSERQKKYFLSAITKTHRMRFEFFANLLHICHRMLAELGQDQLRKKATIGSSTGMGGTTAVMGHMFPSLWFVMCVGEHQSQLAILKWFQDMAADEFLFNVEEVEAEERIAKAKQKEESPGRMQIHKETEAGGSKNTDSTDVEGKDELLAVELKDGILEGLGVSLVEELGHDDEDGLHQSNNRPVSQMEKLTLWDGFMWLGVTLLNLSNLKLEHMTKQKRRFAEENFGDMRDTVCDVLVFLWDKLGSRKLAVIDQLSLPLLRLTDSGHGRTREFGSSTYFDLLRTEYADTRSLSMVENATIDAVTSIVAERNEKIAAQEDSNRGHQDGKSPGEGFLELFTNQLEQKFRDDEQLQKDQKLAAEFLGGIKELFELLSTLSKYERSADSSVFEDERTASMLKLMMYLKEKSRVDMYMHSIQRLRALHLGLGNYVEAAAVLLLAINDSSPFSEDPSSSKNDDAQGKTLSRLISNRSLLGLEKEWSAISQTPKLDMDEVVLTRAAIGLYKKGSDWQSALRLLQHLRVHYEQGTFEFDKLATVLEEQADLYRKWKSAETYHCSHFRVAFRGLKWDRLNANKVFIYRGGPLESIMEFIARIKRKMPKCVMVPPNKETPEMDTDTEKCYLQVSSVKPAHKELWDDINSSPNFPACTPKNVVSHRLHFNVNTFTLQMPFRVKMFHGKPKAKSKNEFMDLWSRTMLMRTAETLPTTIRRSEIVEVKEVLFNPLEVAVRTVLDKNNDLKDRIAKANQLTTRSAPQSFTMAINGTVDAAVNGGLANYAPFLTGSFEEENPEIVEDMDEHPEKRALIGELKNLMESHLVILKKGVEVHARVCDSHMLPLHEIIIKKFPVLLESCRELGVTVPQWG